MWARIVEVSHQDLFVKGLIHCFASASVPPITYGLLNWKTGEQETAIEIECFRIISL